MEKVKAVIYARVSTQGQDYDRQLAELRQYADRMGYEVVKTFSEKISGAKKSRNAKRCQNFLPTLKLIRSIRF